MCVKPRPQRANPVVKSPRLRGRLRAPVRVSLGISGETPFGRITIIVLCFFIFIVFHKRIFSVPPGANKTKKSYPFAYTVYAIGFHSIP